MTSPSRSRAVTTRRRSRTRCRSSWTPASRTSRSSRSAASTRRTSSTGRRRNCCLHCASSRSVPSGLVPASVRVRVPAKVNLRLGVGPLRPDGYHELLTVFHAVGLFDEVAATDADGLLLTVTGTGAGDLPADRNNLAWRAADLLAGAT